jgi:chemotaxis protein methyltransferase CheR
MDQDAIEDLEINLLLQGLKGVYGHDFFNYSPASLKRRLQKWLAESEFESFSQAQSRILREPAIFESLLQGITVNVTEMYRDPTFFAAIREEVIPFLKTYPFVKIWLAGCATGEEVYSMAILLHEAGMQGHYTMYATDINEHVLQQAKEGVFPLRLMRNYTQNYQQSGGTASFVDYYTAAYDRAIFMAALKRDIVFSQHNLASDGPPGEMHLILCRNVMIYFKPVLKERCIALFDSCLLPGGFLCLGAKETLEGKRPPHRYENIANRLSIFRKTYG